MFLISGVSIIAFVFYALALPVQAESFFGWLRPAITSTFDGFFLAAANIFVLFCLFLIVSPWGAVRLGGAEATPDYTYIGWFAMLFAAGMGIGLMFYGVSEPMSHFSTALGGITEEGGVRTDWAPPGAAAANEAEAIRLGMAATIFHLGLHPWAIYAVVALALALFSYNKGLPLTIRSAFYPIFGTSSDSGSLVIDTITAGGKVDAPVPQRVFWAIFEGAVAIALLLGGGLSSLQAMVISTGLPFTLVLLVMCWAILRGLRDEVRGT